MEEESQVDNPSPIDVLKQDTGHIGGTHSYAGQEALEGNSSLRTPLDISHVGQVIHTLYILIMLVILVSNFPLSINSYS